MRTGTSVTALEVCTLLISISTDNTASSAKRAHDAVGGNTPICGENRNDISFRYDKPRGLLSTQSFS